MPGFAARRSWRHGVVLACTVGLAAMPASGRADSWQAIPPPSQTPARQTLPEQKAFDDAGRLTDPAKKLEAYRRIVAEYPKSPFLRMVESSILYTLLDLPERAAEVGPAFQRVVANIPPGSSPESRLSLIQSPVSRLLERNVVLPEAESALSEALAAFEFETFAKAQRESVAAAASNLSRAATGPPRPPPTESALRARYNISRAAGLEVLARLHMAAGDHERALREFRDALALSPFLTVAPVALAQIEAKRGNLQGALDYYLTAAAGGKLKKADDAEFRALYAKVHGGDAGLEDAIDRVYRETYPNPVHPEPWTPSSARSNRLVLAELFTGSGCGPCVAADYALDAVLERYPATAVATLVHHVHVPAPDPMTTPGSTDRRYYYEVKGVPTFNVDGVLARLGGGGRENSGEAYAEYIKAIDKALEAPSRAALAVRAARNGQAVTVSAVVSELKPDDAAKGVRLHIALVEPMLRFSGENGMRFHPLVVRALAGAPETAAAVVIDANNKATTEYAYGLPVKADAEGRATIEYVFDLARIPIEITRSLADELAKRRKTESAAVPREYRAEGHAMTAIDAESLIVVAYLQDSQKRVLQAARIDLAKPAAAGR